METDGTEGMSLNTSYPRASSSSTSSHPLASSISTSSHPQSSSTSTSHHQSSTSTSHPLALARLSSFTSAVSAASWRSFATVRSASTVSFHSSLSTDPEVPAREPPTAAVSPVPRPPKELVEEKAGKVVGGKRVLATVLLCVAVAVTAAAITIVALAW